MNVLLFILAAVVLGYAVYAVIPTYWCKWCSRMPIKTIAGAHRIVLSFDDGPDPRYTGRLLDLLRENGVHACFFLVAARAERHPALVDRMLAEGHQIALHAYEHKNAWCKTPGYVRRDFEKSLAVFEKYGWPLAFYRPPWGMVNLANLYYCRKHGLRFTLWSVMAEDWSRHSTSQTICEKLAKRVKSGSIICLHDAGGDAGAPENTLQALATALPALVKAGYTFQKLEEETL